MNPHDYRLKIDTEIAVKVFGWEWLAKSNVEADKTHIRRAIFPPTDDPTWIRWNFNPAHWGKAKGDELLFSDWDRCCSKYDGEKSIPPQGLPHYSTDPGAAMEVLKKCVSALPVIELLQDGSFYIWSKKDTSIETMAAKTLEMEICLFALNLFGE